MPNFFDDLAKRRGLTREVEPTPTTPSDLAGAVANLVRDEIARQLANIPRQPGQKPLAARAQATLERMERAVRGVSKPAPSVVPKPAPSWGVEPEAPAGARHKLQTGDRFHMSILDRDHRGGIWHTRFDGPDGRAFIGTVGERDANGRIQGMSFERVA